MREDRRRRPLGSAPPNPAPFTIQTAAGTKIHVIQTGWGATKKNAYTASGPGFLRMLRFLTDGDWTDWFPVNFYAVERPGGAVVHDTGETARIYEDGYYRCGALTEWIDRNHFRFAVAPEFELGPQRPALASPSGWSPRSSTTRLSPLERLSAAPRWGETRTCGSCPPHNPRILL